MRSTPLTRCFPNVAFETVLGHRTTKQVCHLHVEGREAGNWRRGVTEKSPSVKYPNESHPVSVCVPFTLQSRRFLSAEGKGGGGLRAVGLLKKRGVS